MATGGQWVQEAYEQLTYLMNLLGTDHERRGDLRRALWLVKRLLAWGPVHGGVDVAGLLSNQQKLKEIRATREIQ